MSYTKKRKHDDEYYKELAKDPRVQETLDTVLSFGDIIYNFFIPTGKPASVVKQAHKDLHKMVKKQRKGKINVFSDQYLEILEEEPADSHDVSRLYDNEAYYD